MSGKTKTAVVYNSKTGFTQKYAVWLSEELHCDLLEAKKIKAASLLNYDTVIYGGGIYAGHINGIKLITGSMEQLKGKKIVVFAVGSSPVKEDTVSQIQKVSIPEEYKDRIKLYYLRGGFDYNRLGFGSKLMMKLLKSMISKSKNPDENQKQMVDNFYKPQDYTDRNNLKQILESVGV